MAGQKIDAHDHLQQYCRMLGHKVPFRYCRKMNSSLPCNKTLDCWKSVLPIDEFIKENYSDDEIALILKPAEPKLIQIFELMKKAEKNVKRKQRKDS